MAKRGQEGRFRFIFLTSLGRDRMRWSARAHSANSNRMKSESPGFLFDMIGTRHVRPDRWFSHWSLECIAEASLRPLLSRGVAIAAAVAINRDGECTASPMLGFSPGQQSKLTPWSWCLRTVEPLPGRLIRGPRPFRTESPIMAVRITAYRTLMHSSFNATMSSGLNRNGVILP